MAACTHPQSSFGKTKMVEHNVIVHPFFPHWEQQIRRYILFVTPADYKEVLFIWLHDHKKGSSTNLRTFARKFSSQFVIFKSLLQSDNELLVSEMQKIGGHRLRFRDKPC